MPTPKRKAGALSSKQSVAIRDTGIPAGGTKYSLNFGEALHVTGFARLTVQSGAIRFAGCTVTASKGPVDICADARIGGPLVIEAIHLGVQIPLISGGAATFTVDNCQPLSWNAFIPDEGTQDAETASPSAASASEQSSAEASASELAACASRSKRSCPYRTYEVKHPQQATAVEACAFEAMPHAWHQTISEIGTGARLTSAPAPIVAVIGSKKTGKSSFARLLVNFLLERCAAVAFLDTDCGQPEFTAPGIVSLTTVRSPVTGPPHMHTTSFDRAHFIGDVSPQVNPALYVSAVTSLITWHSKQNQKRAASAEQAREPGSGTDQSLPLPLVVNTHGWIKGAGLDMLREVLSALRPSHLVQMQSDTPSRNLPDGTAWLPSVDKSFLAHLVLPSVGCSLAGITPGCSNKSLPPVDIRALSWLAFGRCCLDAARFAASQPLSCNAAAFTSVAVALSKQPPFAAAMSGLHVQVMNCAVPRHEVFEAMNGTVVGLSISDKPSRETATITHVLTAPAADTQPLNCVGLGIVRAIDSATGSVYILSPVSAAKMQQVDTLQVGRLHLPPALLQAPGLLAPHLALFSLSTDGSASRSMKSRGNLQRAVHG